MNTTNGNVALIYKSKKRRNTGSNSSALTEITNALERKCCNKKRII
jgi:hypothetical protein